MMGPPLTSTCTYMLKGAPWQVTQERRDVTVIKMRRSVKAVDLASGKSRKWRPDAHEAGINCLAPLSPAQVASGDDDGCVKLWDPRQPAATAQLREHTDYVSGFAHQVLFSLRGLPAQAIAGMHAGRVGCWFR